MDIKAQIQTAVKKITDDPKQLANFKKDPVKTVEGILGVDLPDDVCNQVIAAVKAKIATTKAGDALENISKLF